MQNNYLNGGGLTLWESIFTNPANIKGGWGGYAGSLFSLGASVVENMFTALPLFVSGVIKYITNFVIGYGISQVVFGKMFALIGQALNDVGFATVGLGFLPQLIMLPIVGIPSILLGFSLGPNYSNSFYCGILYLLYYSFLIFPHILYAFLKHIFKLSF